METKITKVQKKSLKHDPNPGPLAYLRQKKFA